MIKTMGEMLEKMVAIERSLLEKEGVVHGPTVGSMYESVATTLLKEAVFNSDSVDVVSGFIQLPDGKDSPEMDCIVVAGETTPIRHSDKCRCKIEDVVAVIQVKKTLYATDIDDSFNNLASVKNIDSSNCVFNKNFLDQTFQRVAGVKFDGVVENLGHDLASIYHILASSCSQPVCIAMGFEGYVDHDRFRTSVVDSVEARVGKANCGVSSMPDLIMNQNFAAMKLNGLPFYWPMKDGWWPVFSTTQVCPIICLLEVLYTKMVQRGLLDNGVFGEDFDQEPSTLLISAKYDETKNGFMLKTHEAPGLASVDRPIQNWEPVELTLEQYVIVTMLCLGKKISVSDIGKPGVSQSDVDYLQEAHLIGLEANDKSMLGLITGNCQTVILPNRKFIAADNQSGRLTRWLNANFSVSE